MWATHCIVTLIVLHRCRTKRIYGEWIVQHQRPLNFLSRLIKLYRLHTAGELSVFPSTHFSRSIKNQLIQLSDSNSGHPQHWRTTMFSYSARKKKLSWKQLLPRGSGITCVFVNLWFIWPCSCYVNLAHRIVNRESSAITDSVTVKIVLVTVIRGTGYIFVYIEGFCSRQFELKRFSSNCNQVSRQIFICIKLNESLPYPSPPTHWVKMIISRLTFGYHSIACRQMTRDKEK